MNFEKPQFDKPVPEKENSLKKKLRKAAAIGAVALAAFGGEGCSPKESGSDKALDARDNSPTTPSVDGFKGYGVSTEIKNGQVVKTEFGKKEENGETWFSGSGISTETEDGEATKSPYGEEKGGKKKFSGYGIER